MACNQCDKIMVVKEPGVINTSIPPSVWMRCECGNIACMVLDFDDNFQKSFEERFKEANSGEENDS